MSLCVNRLLLQCLVRKSVKKEKNALDWTALILPIEMFVMDFTLYRISEDIVYFPLGTMLRE